MRIPSPATFPVTTDTIWTIGHSTRDATEFVAVLTAHEIEALVDVRQHPGSRRYPHFNPTPLAEILAAAGIEYHLLTELGGRRKPRPTSANTVWRNRSFQGYADYMETEPFRVAVEQLLAIAARGATAIMCAEAVWWRCHRSLIADYLKAMGIEVIHIMDAKSSQIHPYTSAARLVDGRLSYREEEGEGARDSS